MINIGDLEILKDKVVYDTTSDKHVVYEKNQTVLSTVDLFLLGFYNGYSYSCQSEYLIKRTLTGGELSSVYLNVEYGKFKEGLTYFYVFRNKMLHKVDETLDILWSIELDDYIHTIEFDYSGNVYVIFKNISTLRKYNANGDLVYYVDIGDAGKDVETYDIHLSDGGDNIYVLYSEYDVNTRIIESKIAHYEADYAELLSTLLFREYTNKNRDDAIDIYTELYLNGDYFYILSKLELFKINVRAKDIWSVYSGIDGITKAVNEFAPSRYSDTNYIESIYYSKIIGNTGGYEFGKYNLDGNSIWAISRPTSKDSNSLTLCTYQGDLYLGTRKDVLANDSFVLSLDDETVLFECREGNLVRIIQRDYSYLYTADNYKGAFLIGRTNGSDEPSYMDLRLLTENNFVVTENNEFILLTEFATREMGYFKLVGKNRTPYINDYSAISTSNNMFIESLDGLLIETLYPYITSQADILYVVDADGNMIPVNDGDDITGMETIQYYMNLFYILADEHMYIRKLCTKKDGIPIVTKKHSYYIARKSKYVYRFVIERMSDIDVVVEHLIQNNLLDTTLPEYVDRLRYNRESYVASIQKETGPILYDLAPVSKKSYMYEATEYMMDRYDQRLFMINNMPYIHTPNTDHLFIKTMIEAVTAEDIYPFLVFINGKVVKWSDMVIIRDRYYSYIMLSGIFEDVTEVSCILLPCIIRYGEDNNLLEDHTTARLLFDEEGLYTINESNVAMRVEIIDSNIHSIDIHRSIDYVDNVTLDLHVDHIYKTNPDSILIFEDGKFVKDSRLNLDNMGLDVYNYDTLNKPVLNINCINYYNKNHIHMAMINQLDENNVIDMVLNNNSTIDPFKQPFDFALSRDKTYIRNMSETISYILDYKIQLLIDYYRDLNPMNQYTFNGKTFIDNSTMIEDKKVFIMTRKHPLDYIVIYLNGLLYEEYHNVISTEGQFIIPIDNIVDEDVLEIQYYDRSMNNIVAHIRTLTLYEPDSTEGINYIPDDYRDGFLLFGQAPSGSEVYPRVDIIKYPLEITKVDNIYDNSLYIKSNIEITDPYYYNKKVNIVSNRANAYVSFIIEDNDENNMYRLDELFNYAFNKKRYMVFVNGIKINQSDFDIKVGDVPGKPSVRADYILLYDIAIGDRVEVFYVPFEYEESNVVIPMTEYKQSLILDASTLQYPFDNELFGIYINGKKVVKEKIENISSNRVRVSIDENIENANISICRYFNPDTILRDAISYSDLWSQLVNDLSIDDFNKLFPTS